MDSTVSIPFLQLFSKNKDSILSFFRNKCVFLLKKIKTLINQTDYIITYEK